MQTPMQTSRINLEQFLFGVAFLLALGVRVCSLGARPLADGEARLALEALSVARGGALSGSAQPAYVLLTGGLFWIFGSPNFLARLLPTVAGGLLVLAPYLYRRILSRPAGLVLAFGLALDPGLVMLSRQAGSTLMAVSFLFLAVGLAYNRRWIPAGIFAGLASLCGPAVIQGLIIAGLGWLAWSRLGREDVPEQKDQPPAADVDRKGEAFAFLASLVITILLAGTLLFRYPQGLGEWLAGLPAYLAKWIQPSGLPAFRPIIALLVYQPLAVIFAGVAVVRWGMRREDEAADGKIILAGVLLAGIALLLVLANPGREMGDMAWVSVFVWALAAMELGRYCYLPETQWAVPAGLAGMIALLMAVFWLQLASMSTVLPASSLDFIRPLIVVAIFALAGLMTWLVASALSWESGRLGLVWGVALSLGIYLAAEIGGIANITPSLRELDRLELWQPYPQIAQAQLLDKTIMDLSTWNTGRRDAIDIRVDVDAPSLRWVLRSFNQVSYSPAYETTILPGVGGQSLPSIFITRQEAETPSLTAAYRGQDFDWWQSPAWEGATPPNFLQWLLYRKTAWQSEQVIVWARADLFPGGTLAPPAEQTNPDQGNDSSSNQPVK